MGAALLGLMFVVAMQSPPARPPLAVDTQRAQQHDRAGWKALDGSRADDAVKEFRAALQINPEYADALHGLGKASMALQHYPDAVDAFERCRLSYLHSGTQDAERGLMDNAARQSEIQRLQQQLQQAQLNPDPSPGGNSYVANLRLQIHDLQAVRDPGPAVAPEGAVPAFVSLALGSAYFRVERLADAERMFREAIAVQPAFGEAHSNLALVCLLTGRAAEAEEHIRLAEEARFKVNPELKRRVRAALGK